MMACAKAMWFNLKGKQDTPGIAEVEYRDSEARLT